MLYLPQIIRRPLGKVRRAAAAVRRNVAAPKDFCSARTALLACANLSDAEKDMLKKASLHISMADQTYIRGQAEHYLRAGLSALRCITRITRVLDDLRIDRAPMRYVLDLPSGGGRVLRFLQIAFPDAALVACDTNEALLDFCGRVFGAQSVRLTPDFEGLHLPSTFDLIWCGSLLTHLDETRCTNLLRLFYNHLSPEGVCIFSTHGTTAVRQLRSEESTYGLSRLARQSLLSQVTNSGFGYVNYNGRSEYGIALAECDTMVALAETVGKWSLAAFLESGWDNFQDIYAFTKCKAAVQERPFTRSY